MRNPLKSISKGLESFADRHPLTIGLATLYVGATIAVNTLFYAAQSGMEGIERACGVKSTQVTATLRKKEIFHGPNGERVPYGIFTTRDGQQQTLVDYPVVTEGKLACGTLEEMKLNKEYDLKVFGSPRFSQRIVDAKESSH